MDRSAQSKRLAAAKPDVKRRKLSAPEPKRRNAEATKLRILKEAEKQFAAIGYAQTGFRGIAERADVAASLLVRHFGGKADLFEAALLSAMEDYDVMGVHADFGARMARSLFLDADIKLPSMVVLSIGNAESQKIAGRIVREKMIPPLAKWLGPPNARARAMNIMMILTGAVIYARQFDSGPVSPHTIDWLSKSLQSIVDEN
jgi:AcrR family transcriptional regulator